MQADDEFPLDFGTDPPDFCLDERLTELRSPAGLQPKDGEPRIAVGASRLLADTLLDLVGAGLLSLIPQSVKLAIAGAVVVSSTSTNASGPAGSADIAVLG